MDTFSRKKFLRVAGGATLGLVVTSPSAFASRSRLLSKKKETVKLTMWSHEGEIAKFLSRRARELNAAGTSKYVFAPVEATVIPLADVPTKFLAAASAGTNLPDLLAIEINAFSRYMKSNIAQRVLLDLTDEVDPVRAQFFESSLDPYSVGGRLYALESAYTLCAYYYKPAEFKKLGIPKQIDTWEEMLKIGARVGAKGKHFTTIATGGGGVASGLSGQFIMFLLQRGGGIFDSSGKLILDSAEAVQALDLLVRGLKNGTFLAVEQLFGPTDATALQTGKMIGHEGADWWKFMLTRNAPDQSGEWRLTPMPQFSKGGFPTSHFGGTGYAIAKGSKHQEAAWELLSYSFLRKRGQIQKFKETFFLPTLKSAFRDPAFLSYKDPYFGGQQKLRLYAKLAPDSPTQRQSPFWAVATQALDRELSEAFALRKTPRAAIKAAAAAVARSMKA